MSELLKNKVPLITGHLLVKDSGLMVGQKPDSYIGI
jgi:hypothetical protein